MRNIIEKIKNEIKSRGVLFASWFGINNPFGGDSFSTIEGTAERVGAVIKFAINASGIVAVVVIVYGAYLIIISAGDSDKYEQGMSTIQAAIIGMIIVFLAAAIINFLIQNGIIR